MSTPAAPHDPHRFLTLAQVAEELSISMPQAYALVRSRELPAIQIGGRGQWRIERAKLEKYITHRYHRAAAADLPDTLPTNAEES